MVTLRDLIDNPLTNPYTIDIIAPNLEEAATLAGKLRALPKVGSVIGLDSFVPEDQQEKLATIADAATILAPTLAAPPPAAPVTPEQLRMAAIAALAQIEPALPKLPNTHPLAAIAGDLRQLRTAAEPVSMAANASLTRFLPAQLNRLRAALTAEPVDRAAIPPDIAQDWLLPDGRTRLQVTPRANPDGSHDLQGFVEEVARVAPEAGGSAVTIQATSATIVGAFRSAAIYALLAIMTILFVVLRRVLDVALVMTPLLLSSALTLLVAVAFSLPLNFANIIALPLLLGVGVSFNIYFVMNWRAGRVAPLGSATARAVIFSALTTGSAFGSLAASGHPGTASMGLLLLISLGCTLLASLVFVPALLAALPRPRIVAGI
jgi:hopanoid biosynthesis associated RND transporter like protein HpnN